MFKAVLNNRICLKNLFCLKCPDKKDMDTNSMKYARFKGVYEGIKQKDLFKDIFWLKKKNL